MSEVAAASSDALVTVTFELSSAESIPIMRWQIVKLYRMRVLLGLSIVLVIAGTIEVLLPSVPKIGGIFAIGLGVLMLLQNALLYYVVPGRAWKKGAPTRGPLTLTFGEQGVSVHSKNTDAENRWAVYSESSQRGAIYLLKHGQRNLYTTVPKRAFQSMADEARFRTFLERHTTASLTATND